MAADDDYMLPRHGRESQRLTAQHFLYAARQGFHLYPEIQAAIEHVARPKIADIATGNGIWAFELARLMPNADVVGLDISDAQFTPEWAWPRNASLRIFDILSDVPKEYEQAFDVVHVRLLVPAGPMVDHKVFLEQYSKMLKPGGWLQLDELAFPPGLLCRQREVHKEFIQRDELDSAPEMYSLYKYNAFDKKLWWIEHFEKVVNEWGGLQQAKKTFVTARPHLLVAETYTALEVWEELVNTVIKMKNITDPEALKELHGGLDALKQYRDEGTMILYNWNICTARKAPA